MGVSMFTVRVSGIIFPLALTENKNDWMIPVEVLDRLCENDLLTDKEVEKLIAKYEGSMYNSGIWATSGDFENEIWAKSPGIRNTTLGTTLIHLPWVMKRILKEYKNKLNQWDILDVDSCKFQAKIQIKPFRRGNALVLPTQEVISRLREMVDILEAQGVSRLELRRAMFGN